MGSRGLPKRGSVGGVAGGEAVNRADSPSWRRAKEAGDGGELRAADLLRPFGFEVLQAVGDERGYDLLALARVEVKTDLRAAETGNFAAEVSHGGRPSGLSTSTAMWWVVLAGGLALLAPVRVLRAMVAEGNYRRVRAGDGNKAECVLFPLVDLLAAPGVRVLAGGDE